MAKETYASKNISSIIRANEHKAVKEWWYIEGTPLPGAMLKEGSSTGYLAACSEEDTQGTHLLLERPDEDCDIDTAVTDGDYMPCLNLAMSKGVVVAIHIDANIADIKKGDELVVASDVNYFKVHPNDLAVDLTTTGSAVATSALTGYRKRPTSLIARESLTKDASDDKIIEAVV